MLEINDIISPAPDASTAIEGFVRFVGIDLQNYACLIRLDQYPLKAPFTIPMSEICSAIQAGHIIKDQHVELDLMPIEQLSDTAKEKMQKDMKLIAPFLDDDTILFDSKFRGRMFTKRAKESSVSPRLLRRLYYQYLYGGKTESALAPHFAKRGGKDKQQKLGTKRKGPKAKDKITGSQLTLPEVRECLEKGAKRFFLPGNNTLEEAFMETKKMYFSNGGHFERGKKISEILLPPEKLPSYKQFRYVCEALQLSLEKRGRKVARRIRQKSPEWDFRGWSRDGVLGPGSRFEIDASKVQIRLVSRYNRAQTLKDPTLYVIVDIWSGAIVGYALSLHNASWALAARALRNCFTDKKEIFERLGLDYSSDDWPCAHLPERLAADRGELVSNRAGLITEIGIVLDIMPPMCPQRKGKIEASIKDIKHGHSHRLPGRHPKFRQRRETDGTDSAALTIDELEQIIVEIIMGLNHDPVPMSHIPPELIEGGETDVTHIGLWRWGLQHRFGHTRKLTQQDVYSNLMTKAEASLTNRGIYFKSQTFALPDGTKPLTHKPASVNGNFRVNILYDEHDVSCIRFWESRTKSWVQAANMDKELMRRKAGFCELEIFRNEVKKIRSTVKDESLHRRSEMDKEIKNIVKQAGEEAREDKRGISKSGRRKNMRENTKLEIEAAKMLKEGVASQDPVRAVEEMQQMPDTLSPASQLPPHDEAENAHTPKQSIADISLQLWEEL